MHTHGTAVLDRSAEATPAPLSALVVGACTRHQEPATCTNTAKTLANGHDVHDLTYGELAVALNASGVHPKRFRSAEPAQLMAWAAQGLALLGIERVRRYERHTRHINGLFIDHRTSAYDRAEYARMWPNSKARQLCHDAAYHIITTWTRPASPDHYPYPLHTAQSALSW